MNMETWMWVYCCWKGQTKGRKYVAERQKMYGRDTGGTDGLLAITDVFSNSVSPANTGNMGKQDRPTKRIGVRDCEVAEKLVLHLRDQSYYHPARTHCILHKYIVKSMALVIHLCLDMAYREIWISWYLKACVYLSPSWLASLHPVPITLYLIQKCWCCYFALRRAATRGRSSPQHLWRFLCK